VNAVADSETAAQPKSGGPLRWLPRSFISLLPLIVALIAVGAYTASQTDLFLTSQNFSTLVQQIAVLGVLATGTTLLLAAGMFDLSIGALAALLSVIGAKLAVNGSGELTILLACMGCALVAGVITGSIVALLRVGPFILTLGAASVYASLALVLAGGRPVPASDTFATLGLGDWFGLPSAGVVLAGILILAALLLRYTRLGRNAYAVGSSEDTAYLAGVPVARVKIALFAISSLLVGVGGVILLGRLGAGDPVGGAGLELQAIAAAVLGGASLGGGRGSILGTLLGVALLGTIANALTLLGVQAFWQQFAYGMVLIIAVVLTALREHGLLAHARRALETRLGRPGHAR
jgi:ribose/xylose/arabinose/galactoside ABC-type transport system permease subunit